MSGHRRDLANARLGAGAGRVKYGLGFGLFPQFLKGSVNEAIFQLFEAR